MNTFIDGLVERGYQNKKIGTKLLSYIINYFFKNGAKSFILEVRNLMLTEIVNCQNHRASNLIGKLVSRLLTFNHLPGKND